MSHHRVDFRVAWVATIVDALDADRSAPDAAPADDAAAQVSAMGWVGYGCPRSHRRVIMVGARTCHSRAYSRAHACGVVWGAAVISAPSNLPLARLEWGPCVWCHMGPSHP